MIAQMRLAPGQTFQGLRKLYTADENGFVREVDTVDAATLLAAGAETIVLPATLDIVVAPGQCLHFDSGSHTADEHGLIRGVPYDVAVSMIRDPQHPAREATAEDLARAGVVTPSDTVLTVGSLVEIDADELAEIRALAAQTDALFAALTVKFDGAEIVDTTERVAPHDDMVFSAVKGGVEIARGTVTELFAFVPPVAEAPAAPTETVTPPAATGQTATEQTADPSASAPHDGDPLPETAPAAE